MPNALTTTRRQKRRLDIPAPGRAGNIKITREGWVACARVVLIEEGIGAVKVDRLAKRLGVTRGGFYHHFSNHHSLLEALLDDWRKTNQFVPADLDCSSPVAAWAGLRAMCDKLIHESGFDPQYDMAVREWARISQPVAREMHAIDAQRTEALARLFRGLGYAAEEAGVRARIFYTHQMGYYTIGVDESTRTREKNLTAYLNVLAGEAWQRISAAAADTQALASA